jgi:hypothetical protein
MEILNLFFCIYLEENESIIVKSAQALHREIPIRLARRIVDLENLTENLPETSSIQKLRTILLSSFEQMIKYVLIPTVP